MNVLIIILIVAASAAIIYFGNKRIKSNKNIGRSGGSSDNGEDYEGEGDV